MRTVQTGIKIRPRYQGTFTVYQCHLAFRYLSLISADLACITVQYRHVWYFCCKAALSVKSQLRSPAHRRSCLGPAEWETAPNSLSDSTLTRLHFTFLRVAFLEAVRPAASATQASLLLLAWFIVHTSDGAASHSSTATLRALVYTHTHVCTCTHTYKKIHEQTQTGKQMSFTKQHERMRPGESVDGYVWLNMSGVVHCGYTRYLFRHHVQNLYRGRRWYFNRWMTLCCSIANDIQFDIIVNAVTQIHAQSGADQINWGISPCVYPKGSALDCTQQQTPVTSLTSAWLVV